MPGLLLLPLLKDETCPILARSRWRVCGTTRGSSLLGWCLQHVDFRDDHRRKLLHEPLYTALEVQNVSLL